MNIWFFWKCIVEKNDCRIKILLQNNVALVLSYFICVVSFYKYDNVIASEQQFNLRVKLFKTCVVYTHLKELWGLFQDNTMWDNDIKYYYLNYFVYQQATIILPNLTQWLLLFRLKNRTSKSTVQKC